MHRFPNKPAKKWIGIATLALAGASARASVLLNENFDSDTNSTVPTNWKDVVNFTTGSTTNSTNRISGATAISPSLTGVPYKDHTTGTSSGYFASFFSTMAGPTSSTTSTKFDGWLISPALAINGDQAILTFYSFSDKNYGRLQVLLSTDGSNNVPNYGAQYTSGSPVTFSNAGFYDNGKTTYAGIQVGDFTTSLLTVNDTHTVGGIPTYTTSGWTQYSVTIPANTVPGTGYIAFRQLALVTTPGTQMTMEGFDDVSVATIPTLTWVNAASNGQWDIDTSANFNTSGSTVSYSDTPNGSLTAGDSVIFNDNNGGGNNYNLSIAATVHPTSVAVTTNNAYTFNGPGGIAGAGGLTLTGSGSLTLNEANTYTGVTNVSGGTLNLGVVGALPTGTNLSIGSQATVAVSNLSTGLTISFLSNNGKLDLGNNKLTITTADLTTVTNEIAAGFNGGTWNSSGTTPVIVSSAAANDPTHLTTLGVMQNGTGVLVKYTYFGDANLDGKVDSSDYTRIDSAYLMQQSGTTITGWANGDFNYDGVVNGSDYTLIDNAFNTQGGQFTTEIAATSTAEVAVSSSTNPGGISQAVPEPATLQLLGIVVPGLLGRRNRRCR